MTAISFIGANYVARELGYKMTGGWGQGDKATQEHFKPIETFEERFEEILRDVLGFDDNRIAEIKNSGAVGQATRLAAD